MNFRVLCFGLFILFFVGVGTTAACATERLEILAHQAISENQSEANTAIAALREAGPAGLDALIDAHRAEINRHLLMTDAPSTPAWERISQALDAVGKQRNCYTSQLYWYTDFEAAKAAARASGKPILSLRLLGNLDEELSCANSRFFRTILYANADVSEFLRQRFVLHWKSVRPVPKVTIDFGDGRKMERTITGNSIHYVLDSEGRVVDALPGLYGPQTFLRGLKPAHVAALLASDPAISLEQRAALLNEYYSRQSKRILTKWNQELALMKPDVLTANLGRRTTSPTPTPTLAKVPTARDAAPVAVTKRAVEINLLKNFFITDIAELEAATDQNTWQALASLHFADAKLDERSLHFIRRQGSGTCGIADAPDQSGTAVARFDRMVQNFERLVALDTVRNEYLFHTKIYDWLQAGGGKNVDELNERVYAELFLTPSSDPWLGLLPTDTYTAIQNEGIVSGDKVTR
ncbi:MAG: hypothetical protein HY774_15310 [Acidobacteria bacterium]|nr:hypothetical protein [Acidobacteriota bacterium]